MGQIPRSIERISSFESDNLTSVTVVSTGSHFAESVETGGDLAILSCGNDKIPRLMHLPWELQDDLVQTCL